MNHIDVGQDDSSYVRIDCTAIPFMVLNSLRNRLSGLIVQFAQLNFSIPAVME